MHMTDDILEELKNLQRVEERTLVLDCHSKLSSIRLESS
jgi:hypothetical protein